MSYKYLTDDIESIMLTDKYENVSSKSLTV